MITIKDLEMERLSQSILDSSNLITWVSKSWTSVRSKKGRRMVRERHHGKVLATCCWLGRWRKRATNQRMWAASRDWEQTPGPQPERKWGHWSYHQKELNSASKSDEQEIYSPLKSKGRNIAWLTPWFSPSVTCVRTSDLQNCKVTVSVVVSIHSVCGSLSWSP